MISNAIGRRTFKTNNKNILCNKQTPCIKEPILFAVQSAVILNSTHPNV